jgi:TM2 domain-containing membrane protein YozV
MNKTKREKLYEMKKKNPTTAVLISLLISGAGHWYINKWWKGILLLLVQIILWSVWLGWIIWIVAPISAYNDTKRYNEELKLEMDL